MNALAPARTDTYTRALPSAAPPSTTSPFAFPPPYPYSSSYFALSAGPPARGLALTVQYDARGRLQPFVETAEQRRARTAFLRKRGLAALLPPSREEGETDKDRAPPRSRAPEPEPPLRTIDEEDEPEPEVIYATAPAAPPSPSPSRWTFSPPALLGGSSHPASSPSSPLSSISEAECEED